MRRKNRGFISTDHKSRFGFTVPLKPGLGDAQLKNRTFMLTPVSPMVSINAILSIAPQNRLH
jgi:hypothetical protein